MKTLFLLLAGVALGMALKRDKTQTVYVTPNNLIQASQLENHIVKSLAHLKRTGQIVFH